MRTGKAVDDGYRGIHLYYIESNFHYPIEIQIDSEDDRRFADWTHMMTYKYVDNPAISAYLKKMYDEGLIKNALEFKEALDDVLSGSKKF